MASLKFESAEEPEELQGEPRWSSILYAPHPHPAQWSRSIDEKLMLLVTQSTASGERFPVGVNWMEVSQVVQRSPVDCVKRYAFLHDAREQYNSLKEEHDTEAKMEANEETKVLEEELEGALLDSDECLEVEDSPSDFGTPVASPKLQSLGAFGDFESSRPASPESPPPFAVPKPTRQSGIAGPGESPFRWESLVNDPNYTAPVLNSPPSERHNKQTFQDRFGLADEEAKASSFASSSRMSPQGFVSSPDFQDQISEMGVESAFSPSILTHAFKGLKLGMPLESPPLGSPLIGSPRLGRKISNSEYPFLKDESIAARQSAVSSDSSKYHSLGRAVAGASSEASSSSNVTAQDLQRQMNSHIMQMSAMSGLSSFTESVTQSALEDAFLDMAGSRLDASSVLLSSRMSANSSIQPPARPEHVDLRERRVATRKVTK